MNIMRNCTIQASLVLCQGYVPEKVAQIKIVQIKHKIPVTTLNFLVVRGLTTSSSIVHDYTTRGYKDL
jgi:hypothetical protein